MVLFYSEDVKFNIVSKNLIKKWIRLVVDSSDRQLGALNFIFCSDEHLLGINRQFLSHDYYTDVITFDTSDYNPESASVSDRLVQGDVFISLDTVLANSSTYSSDFSTELYRVMIHGVLHLIGFDDLTPDQQQVMHAQEDSALCLFRSLSEPLPLQKYL